ncbi:MAG: queuosine precursor transporter [Chloroflexota bacterium]
MSVLTEQQAGSAANRSGPVAKAIPAVAIIVIAAYIGAQMIADIASLKIAVVAGLAVDMGTFIYPITFTLRDLVHKIVGKRNAQVLIISAAVINLFMVVYLAWAASMPGDSLADPDGSFTAAFALVFGPLWRIVFASILAEIVSEMVDTEAYHWFVTKVTHKKQWARVLVSNAIAIPIDTAIFAVVAFGWSLPWTVVWQIFLFNLIVKFAVTVLSIPLIYIYPDPDWSEERDQ